MSNYVEMFWVTIYNYESEKETRLAVTWHEFEDLLSNPDLHVQKEEN